MTLLMVLAAATFIAAMLILALVFFQFRRTQGADGSGQLGSQVKEVLAATQHLDQQVRAANAVQSTRLVEVQKVFDSRLQGLSNQASNDAARRLQTDSAGRQELQVVIGDRLQKMEVRLENLERALNLGLQDLRTTNSKELEKIRLEVAEKLQSNLSASLAENTAKISELKATMAAEMEKIRVGNEAQLEKMRETVDEKLQGTLEKRLGESFKLVSERLEQVQRGLGEMQTLATDVGGLKRVLTNVKSRGTWGEVLLSRQLEDVMTQGQYEENVEIRPGSGERVEFAVVLPGKQEDQKLYLPIDSKFPQETYDRLLEAQEAGEKEAIAAAVKDLERALREQALLIKRKYVHPPLSTDFAIMYLPTEGLFAEAIRIPGFASQLQQQHRIMLTGPTTLMSMLNSLQMGFKTLAIEKRSSEVWQVLAAAKLEFGKYAQSWEKLGRHLETAQRTVQEVGTRSRAVERKLRGVETWELEEASGTDENPGVTAAFEVGME